MLALLIGGLWSHGLPEQATELEPLLSSPKSTHDATLRAT